MSKTNWIDRAINISLVAVLLYGIVVFQREHGSGSGGGVNRPSAYTTNDQVPALRDVNYSKVDRTLLMIVASGCKYCTESMPYYRELRSRLKAAGVPVQLAAIGMEPAEQLSNYVRSHDLQVESVGTVEKGTWKSRATPTLRLVNRAGRVQRSWVGLLSKEGQQDLEAALGVNSNSNGWWPTIRARVPFL